MRIQNDYNKIQKEKKILQIMKEALKNKQLKK